jgi:toxin ParE1/3/4
MRFEFLPEAEEEFREAALYYEKEAPGVGLRFIAEVRKGVAFITENPYAAAGVGSGVRRKVLNHFPYSLLYSIEAELIVIVAVAHHKRRPRYWRSRAKALNDRFGRTKKG